MRRMIGAFVVSVLLAPTTLAGQACVGGPSFKDGNMRLGAGARFEDGAKSYGAQFATGSATGGFAQAGLSTVQYDDVSGTGAIVDVTGGWAIDLVPTSKAQFCPLVGFSYQNGPNISSSFGDVSVSAHAFGIGGALGGVAMTSPGFDFVPFAGFTYFLASGTASVAGFSDTQNQNYGEAQKLSSRFFNDLRAELDRSPNASYRQTLETIFAHRDAVTSGLTRADAATIGPLRQSLNEIRQLSENLVSQVNL